MLFHFTQKIITPFCLTESLKMILPEKKTFQNKFQYESVHNLHILLTSDGFRLLLAESEKN